MQAQVCGFAAKATLMLDGTDKNIKTSILSSMDEFAAASLCILLLVGTALAGGFFAFMVSLCTRDSIAETNHP